VEQRALVWRIPILGAVVAVLCGAALVMPRPTASVSRAAAPPGVRIRVQVLNATPTRGLARRATGYLRDRGFDVVDVATAPQARDSTLVIDRSGHPDWAQLVARALGGVAVESRLDSSRYLDVTVLVGRDWTPPAEPFYP
jgi:LytR cell envelope-related transcriptional attenuator